MRKIYCSLLIVCFFSLAFTYEGIFDKKYKFDFGYQYVQSNVLLQTVEKEEILLDYNNKPYKYFDNTYKEFRIKNLSTNIIYSFETKPFDKIWYLLYFGLKPSQTIEINDTHKLSSTEYGWCAGVGLSFSLFPLTLFSIGIDVYNKIFFEKFCFNYYISENDKFKVDTELFNLNILCGINFSKIFWKFIELGCGGEILYRNSSLVDKMNFYTVSGKEIVLQAFLSSRIYLSKNESINLSMKSSLDGNNFLATITIIIGW
jgi:hypothetical protein